MIRRTIHEWGSISYGSTNREIPIDAADRLAAVAKASSFAGRNGSQVLEHGRKALRARGIVGVVATSDCSLEILPKIDAKSSEGNSEIGSVRQRLVHMLAVALDLRLDAGALTQLHWQRESLLEILISLFCQKLTSALRQGMPRRYFEHHEDLPSVRGRLDLTRQFTTLAGNPSLLACRFDALTRDIALNQIMKAAVQGLTAISRTVVNQQRLRELGFVYSEVTDVGISSLRWDDVVLDRTNSRWAELLSLARMLLGQRFQTTSEGKTGGFALLFEMSALFEEYVARMLKRALRDTALKVVAQGGRLYCLENEAKKRLFQTRPDILIKCGDDVVQIIDTKWKNIVSATDDPKQDVSQGDVYQMMAYGQLYKCSRLTLLYPHHDGLTPRDGTHSTFRVGGGNHSLEVRAIDIGTDTNLLDRLRALVFSPSAGAA
jgi:5-methylcytosine-specific restriction enzyme subunit McrC